MHDLLGSLSLIPYPSTGPFANMLNFQNPAVIMQDSRAYNFAVMTFRVRGSCLSWTSGYLQTMAYRERYLYVSLSVPTIPGLLFSECHTVHT
jgi:hypothetical protein